MNLVTVWNTESVRSAPAQAPSPYQIGTTAAPALVINNNSPYTVQILQQGQEVNEVPGNSQLTFPTLAELSLQLDTTHPSIYMPVAPVVTLAFLDGPAAYGLVPLSPDTATQVTGDVSASISGPVSAQINGPVELAPDTSVNANIQNSNLNITGSVNANITNANLNATVSGSVDATITNANLNVQVINDGTQSIPISGNVTANLAEGTTVNASITGTPTVNLAAGTSIQATISNSQVPVTISGTPTVNAVIQNATLPVSGNVSVTATEAIPITNASGGILQVGGTMDVNVQNASLPVTGDVNITAATAVPIKNETGGTVQVGGTVNANIQNSTLPVTISGTPTINANIQNSSIAVTGTVTANLPANTAVQATITNSTVPVTVSGTPTVNANIQNSTLPVTISGTPTINANITNSNLTVALATGTTVNASITGTPTVNLASGTSVNVNTGTVNIGNTPGVNVQSTPNAAGQGYGINFGPMNGSTGAQVQKQFMPNGTVSQVLGITIMGNNFPASSSGTIDLMFYSALNDGTLTNWIASMTGQAFTTDANGRIVPQYIDLTTLPSLYGQNIICNCIAAQIHTISGNVFILPTAENKSLYHSTMTSYTGTPVNNTSVDTGIPLRDCLSIYGIFVGKDTAAGYMRVQLLDALGYLIHTEYFATYTSYFQHQFNIDFPYPLYAGNTEGTLHYKQISSTMTLNNATFTLTNKLANSGGVG